MRRTCEKIKTYRELKQIVTKKKAQGSVVVLANGCFDLLHVGHVRYLEAAKMEGDLLVVAINSDRSVEKLKGSGRPLIPQEEREELVAALESVDYVFIFDDLRLDSILLDLQPQVQVKGTDYTVDTVPEKETVLSYGGRVAICGDPKSHSSTSISRKLHR
jgi:rfaE bifunctional protein nucleotidyltransferase chain/domain